MEKLKEELLKRLSDGVVEMEEDDVEEAAKEYLEAGFPAFDGIMDGLVDGMNRASELYEAEEYFVTDVLLCSEDVYKRQVRKWYVEGIGAILLVAFLLLPIGTEVFRKGGRTS